jgi:tetratricopeptide (TPR) repeat protein
MFRQIFSGLVGLPAVEDDSPLGRAQQLLDQAYRAGSWNEQIQLARQAIEISPDCADAYVLLAENSRTPKEAVEWYEKGIAAAERALGPEVFEQEAGHFWLIFETRPYMHARYGLANALWALGHREQALEHYRELLWLNPNDNQGVRYTLADGLLALGGDEELERLLEQYKDDASAYWSYTDLLVVHGGSRRVPSRGGLGSGQ